MIFQFLISSPHILQHYSNTIKRKIARANNEYCKAKKKKKKFAEHKCIRLKKEKKIRIFYYITSLEPSSRCIYSRTRLTIVNKDTRRTRRHVPSRERERVCNANQESMRRNGWWKGFMHPVSSSPGLYG